jgi:hypothetical protein
VSEAGQAPPREALITGSLGDPGGPLARAARRIGDRLLDASLARASDRLDELAAEPPSRDVLVLSAYRPRDAALRDAVAELRRSRHRVRFALGSMAEADPELAEATVATGLGGGKFENLNAVLAAAGEAADWTLVVDDDVALPRGFLDRLIGVAERLGFALAQPAQSLASHAAWPMTRRRRGTLARESRFVEIGPVTLFRRDALAELTPFPPLRYGWGLDLHWAGLAEERGWRLGIVDALPVRHEHAGVGAAYSTEDAIAEARRFLAGRLYIDKRRAQETVRAHPLR